MADFGDSFIRKIGKNTGKAVSNIIFGADRWINPDSNLNN